MKKQIMKLSLSWLMLAVALPLVVVSLLEIKPVEAG